MFMMAMRLEKLRQVDLNLLITFAAIAEEKSVTAAASRLDRRLRLVKVPHELHPFHFLMAWHPRLNTDPRHLWLRAAMRSTTENL
jgi:DNA-binding transcriptional LysR family regulator